jgi:hypothetical protein
MPTRITLASVRAALATYLASINGAGGGYTYTLSATDQIKAGLVAEPWLGSTACLCYGLEKEGRTKQGTPLTVHNRAAVFKLNAWASTTATDAATRHDAAVKLYEDVCILFSTSASRTLGITGVWDVDVQLDGTGNIDQTDTGSLPAVAMTLTVYYRELTS